MIRSGFASRFLLRRAPLRLNISHCSAISNNNLFSKPPKTGNSTVDADSGDSLNHINKLKYNDPYILTQKFDKLMQYQNFDEALHLVNIYSNQSQSTVLWNKIIKFHSLHGDKNRAYNAFIEMRKRAFEPNAQTFTALLFAFSKSKSELAVNEAKAVFDKIPKYIGKTSLIHVNAMLLVYASHGKTLSMEQLYQAMPRDGPDAPDLVTYSTLLKYHCARLEDNVQAFLDHFQHTAPVPSSGKKRGSAVGQAERRKQKLALQKRFDKTSNRKSDEAQGKENNKDVLNSQEFSNDIEGLAHFDFPQETMITILNIWDDYRDDFIRRSPIYQQMNNIKNPENTPHLLLDAQIVNIMMRAVWVLFKVKSARELVRTVLKKVELVYLTPLYSKKQHATRPPTAVEKYSCEIPMVKLIGDQNIKNSLKLATIDSYTVDYYIKMCYFSSEFTRGFRMWKYVTKEIEEGVDLDLGAFSGMFRFLYKRLEIAKLTDLRYIK